MTKGSHRKNKKKKSKNAGPPKACLRVQNLSKTYQLGTREDGSPIEVHALKDVSFDIFPGEFIAVVGESGSGKSTLIHCIGSFEQPDERCGNAVQYRDDETWVNVWRNPGWYRQNYIGVVFQSFHLNESLRVCQNVEIPIMLSQCTRFSSDPRQRRAVVRGILKKLGIDEYLDNRVTQLAGGERQRVAIARGMVKKPRLLLADEPTGNLDESNKDRIVSVFRDIVDSGLSVLMVTHDQRYAKKYADRIITLQDGRIVQNEYVDRTARNSQVPASSQELQIEKTKGSGLCDADSTSPPVVTLIEEHPEPQTVPETQELPSSTVNPGQTAAGSSSMPEDESEGPSDSNIHPDKDMEIEQEQADSVVEDTQPSINPDTTDVDVRDAPDSDRHTLPFILVAFLETLRKFGRRIWKFLQEVALRVWRIIRPIRVPRCDMRLGDLIVYGSRDAWENSVSLVANVVAILIGTVFAALLIALLIGTNKLIFKWYFPHIPNIGAVQVWADYGKGQKPITEEEYKSLAQWPKALCAIPDIKQEARLFEKETRDAIVTLTSAVSNDPETERLELLKGTRDLDPEGWDILLDKYTASEIRKINPEGLVGETITLQLRRYAAPKGELADRPYKVWNYPVKVVGLLDESFRHRVYASLNMVRFLRDFSTSWSKYEAPPGEKLGDTQVSERTLFEGVRIHFALPLQAEQAFGDIKDKLGERLDMYWAGNEMLYLRDVQTVATMVLVGIGLITIFAGSISIFNTLGVSVAHKTKEIGILRALGVSRGDVFFIFIWQSVLVGLVAGVIGLVGTRLIIYGLNKSVINHWSELEEALQSTGGLFVMSFGAALLIFAVILLICVLAAFVPSRKASLKTPMDALVEI